LGVSEQFYPEALKAGKGNFYDLQANISAI
jgi:hypothetical protein